MSESRCEGLPEGTKSAEMIDERMRRDARCGPTAKLSTSTLTNAALKQKTGRRPSQPSKLAGSSTVACRRSVH